MNKNKMENNLQSVRNKLMKHGRQVCKESLLPFVKTWMKKNKISTINFINGRCFVITEMGETQHPTEMESLETANQLISLSNAVGYELGFYLPQTIKI